MPDYREVVREIERLESTAKGRIWLWVICHLPYPILDAWDWLSNCAIRKEELMSETWTEIHVTVETTKQEEIFDIMEAFIDVMQAKGYSMEKGPLPSYAVTAGPIVMEGLDDL